MAYLNIRQTHVILKCINLTTLMRSKTVRSDKNRMASWLTVTICLWFNERNITCISEYFKASLLSLLWSNPEWDRNACIDAMCKQIHENSNQLLNNQHRDCLINNTTNDGKIKLAATLRWFTAGGAIRIAVWQLLQTWKLRHYDAIDDVITPKL